MSDASRTFTWLARRARWPVPVLLLLSVPVFYYNLGNYGLVNGDEGFYHRTAGNMVQSGDWLTIQWFGELRVYDTFMNAPLVPWARALLITIGGDNYWTMRLVSATCGMLAALLTYRLARQFMTSAESFLAAILLMVSYQFVFLHGARTGELDAVITCIFVWLAYSFVQALRNNRSLIPHHLGLIALINIKLPVIIMPLLFEGIYFTITPRHWKHIKRWLLTLAWMGPLGIMWHLYQFSDLGWQTTASVLGLMSEQASGADWQGAVRGERLGFGASVMSNAAFFGRTLLFGGFPYIIIAPLALIGVWRHRASRRTTDFLRIITLVAMVVLLFFCFVARRFPWYVMPAYPFLAILVARFLFRLDRLGRGHLLTALLGLAAAVAVALTFQPEVHNPFLRRAMNMAVSPQFKDLGGLSSWIYLPVLAMVFILVAVGLRRFGHRLPVHALPALCILLVTGVGGVRIADGLRFTDHVSGMEKLAKELAGKRDRNEPISFPVSVPSSGRGRLSSQYLFSGHYKFASDVRLSKLARSLRPEEAHTMRRSELKLSVTPSGATREESGIRPQGRGDEKRPGRPRSRSKRRGR